MLTVFNTASIFVIQLYYCLLQLSSWCVIINSNLIKPALPLPGTGLVQALEGGVPKLVLRCLVSETVGHNVLFITGRANKFLETATEYEKPFNNKSFITKSMNLNGKSLLYATSQHKSCNTCYTVCLHNHTDRDRETHTLDSLRTLV